MIMRSTQIAVARKDTGTPALGLRSREQAVVSQLMQYAIKTQGDAALMCRARGGLMP